MSVAEYEKLGVFYLGRNVDTGAPYLYESNHLTTHAVVIGMTGSGKTGLSIGLLEEAAIDGLPAIVVDPKGDMGNLLLQFPDLAAADFAPWVPEGIDPTAEAAKWSAGLAASDQDGERIRRLRDAAEVTLYTPGSRAGKPLSILGSLSAPTGARALDGEMLAERATQVATSLLGLVGIEGEPGKSREHVLVATILHKAWTAGENLDLAALVGRVQDPPFERIGVLDLEAFFPKKDRFQLAVAYNAILAAPGFEVWTEGAPLDVASLLWTKEGKPRISVLSIAHLDDAQRMFFVSLLLGQMVSWMRQQPGTPALRALFFMDEVVGYFPPVAMPPSKRPLLLLLKQARAFGLGVVLATQNPVDLDYKGLSNAGTWIIGRLQTERDKARVLDGLEGAASGAFDRAAMDQKLGSLGKRQFYVHDVQAAPVVIESRWALSYLRGPLTREEIKRLTTPDVTATETVLMQSAHASAAPSPNGAAFGSPRPVLPPGVPEVFVPAAAGTLYEPCVLGAARIHFEELRTGLDFSREVVFATQLKDGPLPLAWDDSTWASVDARALLHRPCEGARFVPLPTAASNPKLYAKWQKDFAVWLARTQGVARWKSPALKLMSGPNEDELVFRSRLALKSREARDVKVGAVRTKYAPRFTTLEDKIRRAQAAVARERAQADDQRLQSAADLGAGMLGAFLGAGARVAVATAKRAAKNASRGSKQGKDVERQQAELDALMARYGELQREANAALGTVAQDGDPATTGLELVLTKPKKTGIAVHLVALAWRPAS